MPSSTDASLIRARFIRATSPGSSSEQPHQSASSEQPRQAAHQCAASFKALRRTASSVSGLIQGTSSDRLIRVRSHQVLRQSSLIRASSGLVKVAASERQSASSQRLDGDVHRRSPDIAVIARQHHIKPLVCRRYERDLAPGRT
eukprot:350441-Chlamydomonas_euryale.AAC.2